MFSVLVDLSKTNRKTKKIAELFGRRISDEVTNLERTTKVAIGNLIWYYLDMEYMHGFLYYKKNYYRWDVDIYFILISHRRIYTGREEDTRVPTLTVKIVQMISLYM